MAARIIVEREDEKSAASGINETMLCILLDKQVSYAKILKWAVYVRECE